MGILLQQANCEALTQQCGDCSGCEICSEAASTLPFTGTTEEPTTVTTVEFTGTTEEATTVTTVQQVRLDNKGTTYI